MSGRSGKKIVQFFNSKAFLSFSQQIELLAKTYERRKIGQKHFEQTVQIIEEMGRSVAEVVTFSLITGGITQKAYDYLSLNVAYIMTQDANTDIHTIVQHDLSLMPGSMQNSSRRYPLEIIAPHVFFRFIQRTGTALNYATPEFSDLCGMAILLATANFNINRETIAAKARAGLLSKEDLLETTPAVLPFKQGLLLGESRWTGDNSLDEHTTFTSSEKLKDDKGNTGHSTYLKTSPIPNLFNSFLAKTSISSMEFLGRQAQLYDQLMKCFYGTPERTRLLHTITRTYIGREPDKTRPQTLELATEMVGDLTRIMDGPAWQEHVQHRTPKPRLN